MKGTHLATAAVDLRELCGALKVRKYQKNFFLPSIFSKNSAKKFPISNLAYKKWLNQKIIATYVKTDSPKQ